MVLWGLIRWMLLGRRDGLRARIRRALHLWTWLDEGDAPADAESGNASATVGAPPADAHAPEGFEAVLHREALGAGDITEVIVGGTPVALANVDGAFYALSNLCAHAGGPIGDGTLDGHTVTCPYHGWSYDVRDGTCFVNADVSLDTYEVQVVGDAVCVKAKAG